MIQKIIMCIVLGGMISISGVRIFAGVINDWNAYKGAIKELRTVKNDPEIRDKLWNVIQEGIGDVFLRQVQEEFGDVSGDQVQKDGLEKLKLLYDHLVNVLELKGLMRYDLFNNLERLKELVHRVEDALVWGIATALTAIHFEMIFANQHEADRSALGCLSQES